MGELVKLKKHETAISLLSDRSAWHHGRRKDLFDAGGFDGFDFGEGFCTGASDGIFIRLNSLVAIMKHKQY